METNYTLYLGDCLEDMNAYGDYVSTPKEVASGQLNLFDSQKGIAP